MALAINFTEQFNLSTQMIIIVKQIAPLTADNEVGDGNSTRGRIQLIIGTSLHL